MIPKPDPISYTILKIVFGYIFISRNAFLKFFRNWLFYDFKMCCYRFLSYFNKVNYMAKKTDIKYNNLLYCNLYLCPCFIYLNWRILRYKHKNWDIFSFLFTVDCILCSFLTCSEVFQTPAYYTHHYPSPTTWPFDSIAENI